MARHADAIWEKFEQPSPSPGEQAETPRPERQAPGQDATRAPAARESENIPESPTRRRRAPNRYALLIEKQEHPERAKEIDEELERRRRQDGERER